MVIAERCGDGNPTYGTLRPIAGAAGYFLPHFLADIMEVIVDREDLAAHRAAKIYRTSADPEFNFFIAFLAFHENLTQ